MAPRNDNKKYMAVFCVKNLESQMRVGERLKKAREAKELTLDDIFKKTRIPNKYLEAIEFGNFKNFRKPRRIAWPTSRICRG